MESLLENYIDIYTDINQQTIEVEDQFCNFTHLMWQEFFAAIHIIFFIDVEEFETILPLFRTSRYEVVAKCTFGLCNPKVLNLLTSMGFDTSVIPRKTQVLKSLIREVRT